jgi:hypothetical protein
MTTSEKQALAALLEEAGESWLIDEPFSPREDALNHLAEVLERLNSTARQRLSGNAPEFSVALLRREFGDDASRLRAFLQAIGTTQSTDLLVMVWQLLHGAHVDQMELGYKRGTSFELKIVLKSRGNLEEYVSHDINDIGLLRHFATFHLDGKPVFEGFFPLDS